MALQMAVCSAWGALRGVKGGGAVLGVNLHEGFLG